METTLEVGQEIRVRELIGRGWFHGRIIAIREDGTLVVNRFARMARGKGAHLQKTLVKPSRVLKVMPR